jgi:hypothetical protein
MKQRIFAKKLNLNKTTIVWLDYNENTRVPANDVKTYTLCSLGYCC